MKEMMAIGQGLKSPVACPNLPVSAIGVDRTQVRRTVAIEETGIGPGGTGGAQDHTPTLTDQTVTVGAGVVTRGAGNRASIVIGAAGIIPGTTVTETVIDTGTAIGIKIETVTERQTESIGTPTVAGEKRDTAAAETIRAQVTKSPRTGVEEIATRAMINETKID